MTNPKRKRENEKGEQIEFIMLFGEKLIIPANYTDRVYRCKTCNKEFKTFQALGGHRAGHNYKNPNSAVADVAGSVPEKLHECKICSAKFFTGQALGGHMTIHRRIPKEERAKIESSTGNSTKKSGVSQEGSGDDNSATVIQAAVSVPVLERADSWLELKLALPGGD